jgi:CelD/BcsL family acetyltransferase involved in cellulose biosynthesis
MAQILSPVSLSESPAIRMAVVARPEELAPLRDAWHELFAVADNAAPPLHYDWATTWWEFYGQRYGRSVDPLCILTFRRDTQLVGVLPLYHRKPQRTSDGGNCLCFLSAGEDEADETCPDYLGLLSLAEARPACVELAWQALCGGLSSSYDRLELSDLADCSTMVGWARAYGPTYDLEVSPRGVCPIADLTGGFEAYLARLSSNTRQQSRRLLRAAQKAGACLEVASTPEETMEYFEQMIDLHQQRWQADGLPGCFASTPFTEFHRKLVSLWSPGGRVVLSRLRVGDQTLAVKYGFRTGTGYQFYQSGVRLDDGSPIRSPGIVSFLMLMEHLCEQGVTAFDFLRGSSSYKFRLATTAQPLVQVRRVLWTWRTSVGLAVDLGERAARRLARTLRPRKGVSAAHGERIEESS